ncbi:hypothetical protein [Sphingobium sp.]|uniref:hypothetical protein n=1 Tax=Sphingobium sp. TaxID=1912891 RepID=UPI00257B1ED5|nr:hypothetical protein [Sphingobium sp.]
MTILPSRIQLYMVARQTPNEFAASMTLHVIGFIVQIHPWLNADLLPWILTDFPVRRRMKALYPYVTMEVYYLPHWTKWTTDATIKASGQGEPGRRYSLGELHRCFSLF